ncbi:MAG: PHP domain-containing protein, partial [Planctomycetaceae bacterium]|nr:PHP domain-containing protein [Planctomycetaceae bacterium]
MDPPAHSSHILWYEAELICRYFLEYVNRGDVSLNIKRMEPVGDFRRLCDTVGQLEFLIVCDRNDRLFDLLYRCPAVAKPISQTNDGLIVQLVRSIPPKTEFHVLVPETTTPPFHGINVHFHTVAESNFGTALWKRTGSAKHLRQMEKCSAEPFSSGFPEEVDFFHSLGLSWIPPELREGRQEVEWAIDHSLPDLIVLEDLKGDLHSHSDRTDGQDDLKSMAREAQKHGLEYIAVTDHTKRVAQCNGMNEKQLLRQWSQFDKIQAEIDKEAGEAALKPIRLLKGVEVDILESGEMDLADEVLAQADWVVASLHFGSSQPRSRLTRRMLNAIENPNVCVIAHPTGRFLPDYPPMDVDWEQVFAAAAQYGCFLELNSHPKRLDLDDAGCIRAKELGIKIVISSDAHSADALSVTRYGINQARRAGLQADDVANTRSWAELKNICRKSE